MDAAGAREQYPRTIRVGLIKTRTTSRQDFRNSNEPYNHEMVDKYENLIGQYMDEDVDVLVAPEYTFLAERPFTADEAHELMGRMAERTKDKDVLLLPGTYVWSDEKGVHNTLPVCYNGEIVRAYDKKLNGGDRDMDYIARMYGKRFAKGKESGVISHKGLDIGVEVCVDHFDYGYLKDFNGSLRKEVGKHALDLQCVVSSGMESLFLPSLEVVRNNGYALMCDGHFNSTKIVQRHVSDSGPDLGRPHYDTLEPVEVKGDLHIYELTIEGDTAEPKVPARQQVRNWWDRTF